MSWEGPFESKGLVYVLLSKYKDNDNEVLGICTDIETLKERFKEVVRVFREVPDRYSKDDIGALADKLAKDGYCSEGNDGDEPIIDYWYEEMHLLGLRKDNE